MMGYRQTNTPLDGDGLLFKYYKYTCSKSTLECIVFLFKSPQSKAELHKCSIISGTVHIVTIHSSKEYTHLFHRLILTVMFSPRKCVTCQPVLVCVFLLRTIRRRRRTQLPAHHGEGLASAWKLMGPSCLKRT